MYGKKKRKKHGAISQLSFPWYASVPVTCVMFQLLSLSSKASIKKNISKRCEEGKRTYILFIFIYISKVFLQDHFLNEPAYSQQTMWTVTSNWPLASCMSNTDLTFAQTKYANLSMQNSDKSLAGTVVYPEDCLAHTDIADFHFPMNITGLTLLPLRIMLTVLKTSHLKAIVWRFHLSF